MEWGPEKHTNVFAFFSLRTCQSNKENLLVPKIPYHLRKLHTSSQFHLKVYSHQQKKFHIKQKLDPCVLYSSSSTAVTIHTSCCGCWDSWANPQLHLARCLNSWRRNRSRWLTATAPTCHWRRHHCAWTGWGFCRGRSRPAWCDRRARSGCCRAWGRGRWCCGHGESREPTGSLTCKTWHLARRKSLRDPAGWKSHLEFVKNTFLRKKTVGPNREGTFERVRDWMSPFLNSQRHSKNHFWQKKPAILYLPERIPWRSKAPCWTGMRTGDERWKDGWSWPWCNARSEHIRCLSVFSSVGPSGLSAGRKTLCYFLFIMTFYYLGWPIENLPLLQK